MTNPWGAGPFYPGDMNGVDRQTIIRVLTTGNPKRKLVRPKPPRERFECYRDGMTVAEYIDAVLWIGHREQQALDDLGWDQNKGYIRLEDRQFWSVADAKENLLEILRLAKAGRPQTIGAEEPCTVVSSAEFAQMGQTGHLGRFLIESAPKGSEFELPSR
jgi:hypothetical protein